nr:Toll/interleukin-1 receptor-like protein [Tanacetum cinerariifolium]
MVIIKEANYKTFYDDEEVKFEKPLKEKLVKGIKASKSFMIVLSKNYAFSTWCLEELILILEQLTIFGHYVFLIFYRVKPSDIGKQLNSFSTEFLDDASRKFTSSVRAFMISPLELRESNSR